MFCNPLLMQGHSLRNLGAELTTTAQTISHSLGADAPV